MHRLLLLAVLFLCLPDAWAAPPADKPFAEEKVVLQISDEASGKQTLVLNVASNLLKHYGPDRVAVEIVAFGPGLRLLLAENANAGRLRALADAGVGFSACQNTVAAFTQQLGHPPALNPLAQPVPAGVVRILELKNSGYTLIKP
jgi:intracellular sulfur oxidation DsrE/DsrF family protein